MNDFDGLQRDASRGPFPLRLAARLVLGILEVFFLLFGVYLLILSYRLPDPCSFIMTFFASNLVILISGALLLGLILKFRRNKET